jgi:hypothetical protein
MEPRRAAGCPPDVQRVRARCDGVPGDAPLEAVPLALRFAKARRRAAFAASVGLALGVTALCLRSLLALALALVCLGTALAAWRCPACRLFIEDIEAAHCTRRGARLRTR